MRAAPPRATPRSLTAAVEPIWAGKGKGRGSTESVSTGGATSQRKMKIVIVSDNDAIGQVTQAFAEVWTVHTGSLLKSGWEGVRDNALKDATVLWLELHASTTASGTRNDRLKARKLMTYVTHAIVHHQIPVVLFAPKCSNSWELEEVKEALRAHRLKESYFAHCAWGVVEVTTGQPARGKTTCWSTHDIAPITCPHPPDIIHVGGVKNSKDRAAEAATAEEHHRLMAVGASRKATTQSRRSATDPGERRRPDTESREAIKFIAL